jgi:hypothetical protein
MKNMVNQEEEGVIAFLAWSNGQDISEISQELRDALFPTISQLPETSKRMCYRMGSILKHTYNTLGEFSDKNEEDQKNYRKITVKSFVESLELNDKLHDLYLEFAYIFLGILDDEKNHEELQEQIKLIVAKESN